MARFVGLCLALFESVSESHSYRTILATKQVVNGGVGVLWEDEKPLFLPTLVTMATEANTHII